MKFRVNGFAATTPQRLSQALTAFGVKHTVVTSVIREAQTGVVVFAGVDTFRSSYQYLREGVRSVSCLVCDNYFALRSRHLPVADHAKPTGLLITEIDMKPDHELFEMVQETKRWKPKPKAKSLSKALLKTTRVSMVGTLQNLLFKVSDKEQRQRIKNHLFTALVRNDPVSVQEAPKTIRAQLLAVVTDQTFQALGAAVRDVLDNASIEAAAVRHDVSKYDISYSVAYIRKLV